MESLTNFYQDISASNLSNSSILTNLDDEGNLFETLNKFQEISNEYTGEGDEIGIWSKFKGTHDSTIIDKIDENSIIFTFKQWSNTAGKNGGMLSWDDISGGETEIWNVTDISNVFDNVTIPQGTIYDTSKIVTTIDIDDIKIDNVSDLQFNKILFEIIYLEKKLYNSNKNLKRYENISDISANNPNFNIIPNSLSNVNEIKNMKKEIIRLYAMIKSRFNESSVNTGFISDLSQDFFNNYPS